MTRPKLNDRIKQGLLLLDGAMGTQLIARGIKIGKSNDFLNIQSPDIICEIHQDYLKAGCDAVLTNTFGANRYILARHELDSLAEKINTTGAEIARQAAGEERYVLGDIGPSGDFLEPVGTLKADELKTAFGEQAKALLAGGVDGFIIETMTALDEAEIAIKAVKSVSKLPVLASFAFDHTVNGFKTMMGVDAESAILKALSLGVDAVGFNCGSLRLDEYIELAQKFTFAVESLRQTRVTSHERRVTVFAEPNAGRPELVDGKTVYKVSPEDFAAAAQKIHSAGISIIGGCCGTGPEHIQAMAKKLKSA
jgi:5-methyltetrahydrofolate--homocysteine methyltransferase